MPAARKRHHPKSATSHSSRSPASQTKRLTISIIGGGRMGTALGRALQAAGHRVQLVVTRQASSARRAARMIGGEVRPLTVRELVSARKTLSDSDLLLISTPDDLIQHVARELASLLSLPERQTRKTKGVALHTSGAVSSDALAPLTAAGFTIASFHPLV